MTTESPGLGARGDRHAAGCRASAPGPDRVSVMLFSHAAFLVVLALLAGQLPAGSRHPKPRSELVIRRIYRTTVVETVPGSSAGTSVSQSVSSSGSSVASSAAATTRSS